MAPVIHSWLSVAECAWLLQTFGLGYPMSLAYSARESFVRIVHRSSDGLCKYCLVLQTHDLQESTRRMRLQNEHGGFDTRHQQHDDWQWYTALYAMVCGSITCAVEVYAGQTCGLSSMPTDIKGASQTVHAQTIDVSGSVILCLTLHSSLCKVSFTCPHCT